MNWKKALMWAAVALVVFFAWKAAAWRRQMRAAGKAVSWREAIAATVPGPVGRWFNPSVAPINVQPAPAGTPTLTR